MYDYYFILLQIYYERKKIAWKDLSELSKTVNYVGVFDPIHGIKLHEANNFLRVQGLIEQTEGVSEHYITEKGSSYYLIEKEIRDKAKTKEDRQDELTQSVIYTNVLVRRTNVVVTIITALAALFAVLTYYKSDPKIHPEQLIQWQRQLQILDSMRQYQKGIDSSLRKAVRDSFYRK